MDKLSSSEQRIFTLGVICATDGLASLKVDYAKLAVEAGLKNGATASVLFNKAKRKLRESLENGSPTKKVDDGNRVTKSRKPAIKGKNKAAVENAGNTVESDENMDDDAVDSKPIKTTKGRKGKAGAKVKNEPDQDDIGQNGGYTNMESSKSEPNVKQESFFDDFAGGV